MSRAKVNQIIWYEALKVVRFLVDEIMGSVCSNIPNRRGVTKIIKVQEQSDLAEVALQAIAEKNQRLQFMKIIP